ATLAIGGCVVLARTATLIEQIAALGCAVRIVEHRGDTVHTQRQGVPKEQDHEQGQGQRHGQAPEVAHDVQELLSGNGPCAARTHVLLSSRSIMAINTSSIESREAASFRERGVSSALIFPLYIRARR